jgi:uncharacterized protein YndB with AHSA1/START domain
VTAVFLEAETRISRPPQAVFAAWSTAEALARWFAPMAVVPPIVELDFRQGGRYSIRMTLPNDKVFVTAGVFQQIVTNERIVMTWRCDAFADAESLVTVMFIADGEDTVVKVTHERFESPDTRDNHRHGWELCLERLRLVLQQ